ncbi:pyridoxamine 5'-phosphate oxidase family protein [Candidatus Saccharibacteria bacterium]|nr:pyridoxamine 5'-phosphate oxidase family protein [Candidatus Saccharibacteria bacterium]
MNIENVKKFLNEYEECVVASIGLDNQPQAATVGFSVQDGKLVFGTNKKTRKYQNILHNSKVAIVVGVKGPKTAQIEGVAKEISGQDKPALVSEHIRQVPESGNYANQEGQTYFMITPTWLRFTDYTKEEQIFETSNF